MMNQTLGRNWIGVLVVVVGIGTAVGCTDEEPSGTSDVIDLGTWGDVVDTVGGLDMTADGDQDMAPDIVVPVDTSKAPDTVVNLCGAGCAPGTLCVPEKGCVQCITDEQCLFPSWCNDGVCVESLCVPNTKDCANNTPRECSEDGQKWIEGTPCMDGQEVCVQGQCEEIVCTPGEKTCDKLQILLCDNYGTGWSHVACPPGSACYTDQCEPITHNVLLIFDTSGSMGGTGPIDIPLIPCVCGAGKCPIMPYPACEDINCPRTRLGLAKKVLNELFETKAFDAVHFAMHRFPQILKAKSANSCTDLFGIGHYQATGGDFMTGDDGAHVPADGSYFDQNLHEILSVPYPSKAAEDTKALAKAWVDGDEQFTTIGTPCQKNIECKPNVCALDTQTGNGECATHTNPELRSTGNTPLGKSLFYAGEYFRKFVVVDGKDCETAEDCGSVNYLCGPNKKCFDPLRKCRRNVVLLFTDGVETPATEPTNFFNPKLQAKRLHYGLGCAFDSDCLNGAKCKTGICQGYSMPNTGIFELIPYIDGGAGANTLKDRNGQSIPMTIHVVDMSDPEGNADNRRIADHGGGNFYPVSDGNPDVLLEAFKSVLNVKANIQDCVPEFPQ